MEDNAELAKFKWLLLGGAIFLLSFCFTYEEVVYLINGHEIQANVTKAYVVTKRGSSRLTVDYTFTEPDGTFRKGSDTVSPDWPLPQSGTVLVQYTAGADGSSRLAGHIYWLGVSIFTVSILFMGIGIYNLVQEANEDVKPRKRRRAT